MPDKIPLIYILSNGRSGSTLLDLLLGMQPGIWTLGEAQILPWELIENRLPCGCGSTVMGCDFWQPIIPNIPIDGLDYPIHYFRERHNGGKAIRWEHLVDLLKRKPSQKWEEAIKEYGQVNAEYFRIVKEQAVQITGKDIHWLVDASKDMYRLFWLVKSELFDLRIIHLMKDPRGFVYSMLRHQPEQTTQKAFRYAGRWLFENGLFAYLGKDQSLGGKTFTLRYETLARQPEQTIQSILTWISNDHWRAELDFREHTNHAIAGNPMRWENTEIKLDQKWIQKLPSHHARITWLLDGILARIFGYKRDPRETL